MQFAWWRSFFSRHGVKVLMWALVGETLASPLADSHPRIGALFGVISLLMVLAGLGQMANRGIVRWNVLPVGAVWTIARIAEGFGNRSEAYANLSQIVGLVFTCSILWAIFHHFRDDFRDSRGAITEAFISYLVIATAYSELYWILNRFIDHAFNQTIPYRQGATFLYFSMVTLTSVGFGGIVPLNPYVRIVAALESMSGIFFVAVVVARLVSSYKPKKKNKASFCYSEKPPFHHDSRTLVNSRAVNTTIVI